jgi:mannose-6-phosphate isomerase-like protein (cupin superfamily)
MEVVSLLDGKPLDPKPVLAGGWRWLRMLTLGPRESERLEAGDVEYAVYVVEGEGTAQLADRTVPIRAGSALTLLKGAEATLGATGGLTLFLVAVDVPNR